MLGVKNKSISFHWELNSVIMQIFRKTDVLYTYWPPTACHLVANQESKMYFACLTWSGKSSLTAQAPVDSALHTCWFHSGDASVVLSTCGSACMMFVSLATGPFIGSISVSLLSFLNAMRSTSGKPLCLEHERSFLTAAPPRNKTSRSDKVLSSQVTGIQGSPLFSSNCSLRNWKQNLLQNLWVKRIVLWET